MRADWIRLAALLAITACAESAPTSPPGPLPVAVPDLIRSANTAPLVGMPNNWLSEPVAVIVTDDGTPVAGVEVHWGTPLGEGTPEQLSSLTDESGIATVRWKLGKHDGPQTLIAAVDGVKYPIASTMMLPPVGM